MSHFKITQAGLISAVTFIVGQLVAFVPAFGPDKQNLISAGTAVIAAVFLIANAIHALVATKVSAKDLEDAVPTLVQQTISKIDFNSLAKDAVSGQNLGKLVQDEVARIFASVGKPVASPTSTSAQVASTTTSSPLPPVTQ